MKPLRLLSLLLILALAASFTACGKAVTGRDAVLPSAPEATTVTEAVTTAAPTTETETAPTETEAVPTETVTTTAPAPSLDENGSYDSKEEVALYIHFYGRLPSNYITKKEAEALGWTGGSLEKYAPGKCIGGSRFGNYEGLLPTKKGRTYTECDIDTLGAKSRGAKRIVYSNDGLIYYTGDHYKSFTLLYGEE